METTGYGSTQGDERKNTGYKEQLTDLNSTLKKSSTVGIDACSKPICASAPAKPRPCNSPKMKATSQGILVGNSGRT
ncbi:MAG: hypothetical protein L3J49_06355 [Desulfobulbaceae bacterium]|nr:hypothetical protein [Desulfobulbaceae bacterium]